MERRQNTQREEQVENQTAVGNHSRSETVEANHIEHQQHKRDDERPQTGRNGLLAERRTDYRLTDDIDFRSHLTALEHVCQVVGFLNGEVTRDLRASALDYGIDRRERIYLVVEHDGNLLAYVFLSNLCPTARTLVVHRHINGVTALHLVVFAACVVYYVTAKAGLAVLCLESYKLEVASLVIDSLHRPSALQIGRKQLLCQCRTEYVVDSGSILHVSQSDSRTANSAVCPQHRGKRLSGSFRSSLFNTGSISLCHQCSISGGNVCRIGNSFFLIVDSSAGSITFAQLGECLLQFFESISFVELKVGRTLQQFAHTFRLLDTRQLKQNLAVALHLLYVRSNHAEAVDTRAESIV